MIKPMFKFNSAVVLLLMVLLAPAQSEDPYLWLEEVESEKALSWVDTMNQATDRSLTKSPLYASIYSDTLDALISEDKLPSLTIRGDWVYRLYKGEVNPRGVYQRKRLSELGQAKQTWQTVIDIDALSKADKTKWVFDGMICYEPANERCLVGLSPGGTDASALREFDLKAMRFIDDGFALPVSKMQFSWIDANHIYVATDFGDGTMTQSGYPRITKKWRRGTPVDEAETVFEVGRDSVFQYASHYKNDGKPIDLMVNGLTFWNRSYFQRVGTELVQLALPEGAVIQGLINNQFVVEIKQNWVVNDTDYPSGSILLIPVDELGASNKKSIKGLTLLHKAEKNAIVERVSVMDDYILLTVLEDVKAKLYRHEFDGSGWVRKSVDLPQSGQAQVQTVNSETGEFLVQYESFISPPALYHVSRSLEIDKVLQQSPTFDGTRYKVEQHFARSKDGTQVPYFVVMHQDTKLDGRNPTLIFSYGGFRVSLLPSYSGSYEDLNGAYGKAWLERGGVFVLPNIRGGGEYGPAWHAAALRDNKVRSYEDFEAVTEDLIQRKITSAKHIGIEGRSNGGLMVGALMIRRPELYGAVICGVPLLDMKRYHKLLAGASWMAEYGDPDTEDWEFIKTYSPYQNLKKDEVYPPTYFFTSTKDDRVHPGHARKMAALMTKYGHQVEYFENTEGGHKGSATSEQTAKRVALGFAHLWAHLSTKAGQSVKIQF